MSVEIFKSKEFGQVRIIEDGAKTYFCGKDVAIILGYENTRKAIADHCKKDGVTFHDLIDNLGRAQQAKFINESNLYRLIVSSKLPAAEKFERWVFEEVLPTIRKHGLFATDELLSNPDVLIKALQELKKERLEKQELLVKNELAKQQMKELEPKATYYDLILQTKNLISITQIAKDYGMSGTKLNKILHEEKVQYKQGKTWLLYQRYADKGYTKTKTQVYSKSDGTLGSSIQSFWTQKGRLFIYNLLKDRGLVPKIERSSQQ